MNVLFVHPPSFHIVTYPGPITIYRANYYAPLGLLYVATYLDQNSDHTVGYFDYEPDGRTYGDLQPELERFQPDVVGITSYTFGLYDVYEICKLVKAHNPNAIVVLGGPHVEHYPEESLQQPFVDYLVKGEGEQTFLELMAAIEAGRVPDDVAGVYYSDPATGAAQFTGERAMFEDLDAIPMPNRQLLQDKRYYSVVNPRLRETSMITSRGCPYRCNFCDVGGRSYRYRSPQNIVDEMEACQQQGFEFIHFYDDTFNLFKRKVVQLCEEIIARGLTVPWSFRGRVNNVDDELMALLKRANCQRIFFGVESGSAELLATIGKRITREEIKNAFALARRHRIETVAYFMVGFPDETREQMAETRQFALEIDPDYVHVTICVPLPGTELWREATADPAFPADYLRQYSLAPQPDVHLLPYSRRYSEKQLIGESQRFYRTFYGRPRYILRKMAKIRSLGEFWRKARTGMGIYRYNLLGEDA